MIFEKKTLNLRLFSRTSWASVIISVGSTEVDLWCYPKKGKTNEFKTQYFYKDLFIYISLRLI